MPGSRLGPYTIVRLIAKGGMGEVYEAHEEVLHRQVALKIIADDAINGIPEVLRLFHTEGKALAQLNHPNVVTIYQLGNDNGIHYIAMEYIEGVSLDEFIRKNKPDLQRDLQIFYRILLGVQALHRKAIIHRDLKPKNVIIQADKVVKIVDFGIAELKRDPLPEEAQSAIVMGSVYYMSPEVARGEKATPQSDIWSLGVILYQLLTRQRPFTGDSKTEILTKIREETMTFASVSGLSIPQKYKELTNKMCSRNPAHRFQSIDEIIRELGVAKANSPGNRFFDGFIGLSAFALIAMVGWQLYQAKMTFRPPPVALSPSASAPVTAAAVTSTTTIPQIQQPALPGEAPPVAAATTSTTTLPQVQQPVAGPIAEKSKPMREALPAPSLKSSQVKMTLDFKDGTSARDPASIKKGMTNSPTLAWQKMPEADSYRIQISGDNGFKKTLVSKDVVGSSFKWESVEPGSFFWRVQARAKSRPHGEFSETGSLQVQLPAPAISKSNFKFLIHESKPNKKNVVDWRPLPMASKYQVSILKKSTRATVATETTSDARLTLMPLPPGEYEMQVSALDSKRQTASLPSSPITVQIQPAAKLLTPVLQQPSDGTIVPSQGTMITPVACSWSPVKKVQEYEFQLSSDQNFKKIVHQTTTGKNQYVLIMPLPRGNFYWRVRATSKEEDSSTWSESRVFKID